MTESYMNLLVRLQIARQEAVGRHRSNVLVETKDLSALLDRFTALEEDNKRLKEALGFVERPALNHAAILSETDELSEALACKHFRSKVGCTLMEARAAVLRHRTTLTGEAR